MIPHVEEINWVTEADGPDYHLGCKDLLRHTIELMRLVKAAVIYLIAFIDSKEQRQGKRGIVAPIPVPFYQPFPLRPYTH